MIKKPAVYFDVARILNSLPTYDFFGRAGRCGYSDRFCFALDDLLEKPLHRIIKEQNPDKLRELATVLNRLDPENDR